MQDLDVKIEQWKKSLLDLGKRNRLINFKETKRSNVAITSPSYDVLYEKIVHDEDKLRFPFPLKTIYDENGEEININVEKGDVETNKTLNEQQKTLKVLRGRAKTSIEEQGINCLYLTFGIMRWKESESSGVEISSPIILVPVTLTVESITDPYVLQLHEDEIVVNPSLAFKFENDFGITLPDFDGHEDNITKYLEQIKKIAKKNDWDVTTDVHLTLLSFLKINMYKDLDNNKDKIVSNPIIKALSGDKSEIAPVPMELNNFNHDKNVRPIDTYQVVDADSSQQDAILLSKKGISFVLQGPPGTGKSQTITNIIAEALSDGKKVLFVSEKMAALEVVKKRLTEAGLEDFCLTLHSYKANKKEILNQLSKTLGTQRISLKEDAIYKLSVLEERRKKLNEYQEQLHEKCLPLNISIYEANGRLAKLCETQDIIFGIDNVENTDIELLNKYKYLLSEFSKIIGKLSEDYSENPWYGCNVPMVTHELRHDIDVNLNRLLAKLNDLIRTYEVIREKTGVNIDFTMKNIDSINKLLDLSAESPIFPMPWISDDIAALGACAQEYLKLFCEHKEDIGSLLERYSEEIFKLNAKDIISTIESNMVNVKEYLDSETFKDNKDIVLKADFIIKECKEIHGFIKELYRKCKEVEGVLGINNLDAITSAVDFNRLLELIHKNPQPIENWFNQDEIEKLKELIKIAENHQLILKNNLEKINLDYDEGIINIDFNGISENFEGLYTKVFNIVGKLNNVLNVSELTKDRIYSFVDNEVQKLKAFNLLIRDAVQASKQLVDSIGITQLENLKDFIDLGNFLTAVIQNPKPTLAWFDENKEFAIDKIILDFKNTHEEIERETQELLNRYSKDILDIDYKNMLIRFNRDNIKLKKCLKLKDENIISREELCSFVDGQIKDLQTYILKFKKGIESSYLLAEILEIKPVKTLREMISLNELLCKIIKAPRPTLSWFDNEKDIVIDKIIIDFRATEKEIKEETDNILLKYNKDILSVDYKNILFRFKSEYGSILKYIKGSYRADKKTIMVFCKEPNSKLDDNEIILLLEKIAYIKEKEQWINDNKQMIVEILGTLYIGEYTNWNGVERNRYDFKCIKESFYSNKIPQPLEKLLIENKVDSYKNEYISISEMCENKVIEFIHSIIGDFREDITIDELIVNMQEIVNISLQMKKDFETVSKYEVINKNRGYVIDSISVGMINDIEIITLLNKISLIKEKQQWLIDNKAIANELFGSLYVDNYTDWEMVNKSRTNFKVIKEYFRGSKIPDQLKKVLLESDTEKLMDQYLTISKIAENNVVPFIESIFGLEASNEFTSKLIDDIDDTIDISMKIRDDYRIILKHAKNSNGMDSIKIKDIIDSLTSVKEINQKRNWFKENDTRLKECYGKHYNDEDTNWNDVEARISTIEQIINYFGKEEVPSKVISYLISSPNTEESFRLLKNNIIDISNKDIIKRLDDLLNIEDSKAVEFDKVINTLEAIEEGVNAAYSRYIDFSSCSKNIMQFETIMTDLVLLNRIQEIETVVDVNASELKVKFDFEFDGINTNWDKVLSSLDYANKFKSLCDDYSLTKEYISDVCCNKSNAQWAEKLSEKLKEEEKNIKEDFSWFAQLFDNGEIIYNTSFYSILDRVERSVNNLALLEEWIDFRSVRQHCRECGLSEFVEKVEEMNMAPQIIVDTFFKRFYRLWLDVMIPKYPAVYAFRSRAHQSIINEFNDLDKLQLEIARLRILERLITRLPNTNIATSSVDEVGILKRELTKQRKIMPLRRLFKAIPNLLTALKPCLMMSPLSVSLFLQADGYNFDTIIFDEASQVCTEDAIGAIMRGKQIIIAGDSKQLPPTSFFAATLSDSDFDGDVDDEEFDDTGAYDSILEEAINAIPERTLKWHYRSRHEHLIAFSNAKIYNNELITFPSNMDKVPDNGVEYIFVENGVYDRGGKKHNLNEAKHVAKLVFQHIRKYPNRSLGVVTFSGSQQLAVDNAIRQLRLENSQYEKFFSEDNDQPFFVKNLENVQGDERDTIIFSIGYAKDQTGVMYMNFGPLSRNGGHRRLNVAITRAKYNVKLVGSIHPTDIKVENTNAEGVKLLRQYIEFAINGPSAIQNELTIKDTVDVDSPFEEAVYDFLVKKGYNVKTQVGCSGYRIDMAVKHPTLSGIFVLGIECDGATYHSARTARERDRLRQTVLEDIGWNIYRIWSTDWIKDSKTEGNKLIEAVEKAIANYKGDSLNNGSICEENYEKDTSTIKEDYIIVENTKLETACEEDNPYNFSYYKETDIYEIERCYDDIQYLTNVVNHVVKQENPIHFELLCKRLAVLFGNQKVTVKVRNSVDYVLNSTLKERIIKKEDFCWHDNVKEIKVKIPNLNGDGRTINHISSEEIAEAMFVIVGKSFGITKNDLCVATARVFGFNRATTNIIKSMEKSLLYLMDNGRVKEVDGKIIL